MELSDLQFELTVKEYSSIPQYIQLLKKYGIKKIAITQKYKIVNSIAVAKLLKESISDLDIMLNFSITYSYSHDSTEIENRLLKFIGNANELNILKFLIVSGAHRKLYSSIDAFNFLKFKDTGLNQFFCAYNPYLSNYLLDEEDERLRYKIASHKISGIYYQLGNDLIKLKRGIKVSKQIGKNKVFFGSVLFPNTFILNKLKENPWFGVKYSDSYLKNLNSSLEDTKKIFELYNENNIKPLIQVIPFNDLNLFSFSKFVKSLN